MSYSRHPSSGINYLLHLAGALIGGVIGLIASNNNFFIGFIAGILGGIFGPAIFYLALIIPVLYLFQYGVEYPLAGGLLLAVCIVGFFYLNRTKTKITAPVKSTAIDQETRSTFQISAPVTKKMVSDVGELLARGTKVKKIASEIGISTSTVYRIKNQKYELSTLPDK